MPHQKRVAKRGEICPKCGQIHERCLAHRSAGPQKGQPCGRSPRAGAEVCHDHGGSTRLSLQAAERRLTEGRAAVQLRKLKIEPRQIGPADALLEEVYRTAGWVSFLEGLVSELDVPPESDPADPAEQRLAATLYGPNHLGDGAARVLYNMLQEQRIHGAKVYKAALDAGIAERQVQLAERQAVILVDVLRRVFDDPELGLSAEGRQKARVIAARHLRVVA